MKFEEIIKGLSEHKIQLLEVQLVEMNVKFGTDYDLTKIKDHLAIQLSNGSRIIDKYRGEALLEMRMVVEDSECPLEVVIKYVGQCRTVSELTEDELKIFLEYQSIPLLWPYIRQAVSDTMTKMSIPPILLPTIDVLETLKNRYSSDSNLMGD
ncbi:hypothetical protein GPDM_15154 [Planococcus donghaensis MPA1U2]|uniref:Preprotein translocase subunit SecB n=1 Tax=Planococcus donghaensis MPA1U2 TaxID=933115 RepID=E7RKK6_9BACL|nr:protein-export chaperone SecB [Planococcus donghaensis]EGA88436.1 hypothetical protein GPDM_15154 [Planococcus donghaensis MPA1U2]